MLKSPWLWPNVVNALTSQLDVACSGGVLFS